MKRGKKLAKKLSSRIKGWEDTNTRSKVDGKAYKKPGSRPGVLLNGN